jgi:hypothetical protein
MIIRDVILDTQSSFNTFIGFPFITFLVFVTGYNISHILSPQMRSLSFGCPKLRVKVGEN